MLPVKAAGVVLVQILWGAETLLLVIEGNMVTDDELPEALQPYLSVTVKLYTPAFAAAALAITGFCRVDVKEFGPVQA